jgi:hypothetical protein
MKIPKEQQIKAVLSEDWIGNFARYFGEGFDRTKRPSDYIDITCDEVMAYVHRNGFDSATVAYKPLEARFLIEENAGQWLTSFHERGQRHGLRAFPSRADAERDVIERLIDTVKRLVDGQFAQR